MTTETDTETEDETTTVIKRRISWAEFYKLRPDLRPDNKNEALNEKAAA